MGPIAPGHGTTLGREDLAVAGLLAAAVLLYVASLPYNLGAADESYYLLTAKRIRDGQAMYRDIFWYELPAAHWTMAGLFALFGTTMRTARLGMALLHAITAALLYLSARRAAVRPALSALVPVAAVALCQAAWPYASPHWFDTALMSAMLWVLLGTSWTTRRAPLVGIGLLTAALTAIHHQKGAVFAAAITALLVLDGLLDGPAPRWRNAVMRAATYDGTVVAVVLPLLAGLVAIAGFDNLVGQIIRLPLGGYRAWNRTAWGGVGVLNTAQAAYTHPRLLAYGPLVLAIGALRLMYRWRQGAPWSAVRPLATLVVMGGAAVGSIGYYPDFIHIAFITPLLAVLAAETLEATLHGMVRGRRAAGALGGALAAALLSALGVQLWANRARAWQEYPIPHQTAFGRVDLASQAEADSIDQIRARLGTTPPRQLFVYPALTSLYLTTGADNPTRHQFLLPGYHTQAQVQEVLDALTRLELPYVVAFDLFSKPGDPILRFVHDRYDCVLPSQQGCLLYRRRGG